jgi:hypothetical protein
VEWPTGVAIYGAVVSTLTAIWNIRSGVRDRGHLKVDLRFRHIVQDTTGQPYAVDATGLNGAQLVLTVTNTGRRPITVVSWKGEYKRELPGGKYFVVITSHMPKELRETEQLVEATGNFAGALEAGVKTVFVMDSADRQWAVPRRTLKAIEAEFARLKAAPPNKGITLTKP